MVEEDVRWLEYPWEAVPGVPEALGAAECRPDGRKWSAGGILSVPEGARVSVLGGNGREYRLPEGGWVLAVPERRNAVQVCVTGAGERTFAFEPPYPVAGLDASRNFRTTALYQTVLSWASFFDECLVDEHGGERAGAGPAWADIDGRLRSALDNPDEPQMSLIVRIADALTKTVEDFERGIRRVLTRDRRMMPADRAEEFDAASIDWYIRQPGYSAAEKAAYNQQRLKAVARKEFVDTLENRVLKDFLRRCTIEADGYRLLCTESQRASRRARSVQKFGLLCRRLLASPAFEPIAAIHGIVQPNYVLQGDFRYRKVWRFYQQLLRQQRAADLLWAWQVRLWSDVVAVTLNVALWRLSGRREGPVELRTVAQSGPELSFEQHEGRRFSDTSDAGPWIVRRRGAPLARAQVLEVVSSAKLADYLSCSGAWTSSGLSCIREATLLLLTPLAPQDAGKTVLIVWPLHSEADGRLDAGSIERTLRPALEIIERRSEGTVRARALVVASDAAAGRLPDALEAVTVFRFGSRPAQWARNLEGLETWLELFLKEVP